MHKNADWTKFVIIVYNGDTSGLRSEEEVNLANFSSGGEGMTMLFRLPAGRESSIQPVFTVFKNAARHLSDKGDS